MVVKYLPLLSILSYLLSGNATIVTFTCISMGRAVTKLLIRPNPFAFTFNLLTYWLNVYHIPWVMIFVQIVFAIKYN